MSNRPKAADWKNHAAIRNAGIRGFNALQELPKLMSEEIDWMAEFQLGFFSEADVSERSTMGWVPLRAEHFDVSEFNSAIGLKFGLTDTDGIVRYNDNVLMIMPKEFRRRLVNKRNEEFESYYARTMSDQAYVVPEDPKRKEILANYATSTFEEAVVTPSPNVQEGTTVKKKRGRPKKK